jgi:hypothetical protein
MNLNFSVALTERRLFINDADLHTSNLNVLTAAFTKGDVCPIIHERVCIPQGIRAESNKHNTLPHRSIYAEIER